MHPWTTYLIMLLGAVIVLEWLWARVEVHFPRDGSALLGIAVWWTPGVPRCDEIPLGLRACLSLSIGIGILYIRIVWWGRVPPSEDPNAPRG